MPSITPSGPFVDQNGTNSYKEMVKDLGPEDPFGWGWDLLSPEGPYLELILAQTREIVSAYEVDGIWYRYCALSRTELQ